MRRRDEGDRSPVSRQGAGIEALGIYAARDELVPFPGQEAAQGGLAWILEDRPAPATRLRAAAQEARETRPRV